MFNAQGTPTPRARHTSQMYGPTASERNRVRQVCVYVRGA